MVGSAERLRGSYMTANTFRLLRVAPLIGRDFVADDDRPGAPAVVMLALRRVAGPLRRRAVGGRPRRFASTAMPSTVIGVMPPGFTYPVRRAVVAAAIVGDHVSAQPTGARAT